MIGVLGGSFAPIHNGHLRLALAARDQLGLDEVRLIPAGAPPLRAAPAIPGARRMRWIALAIRDASGLAVDARELQRPGPSYTVDTLTSLRAELGGTPLCLLVGQDKAAQLPQWHRWRELFALAHLIFFNRPGADAAVPDEVARELTARKVQDAGALRRQPAGLTLDCRMPPVDVSSSAVREHLREGRSVEGLVPDAVINDFTPADLESFAADETAVPR